MHNFDLAQLTVSSGANVFMGSGAFVFAKGNLSNSEIITGQGTTLLKFEAV